MTSFGDYKNKDSKNKYAYEEELDLKTKTYKSILLDILTNTIKTNIFNTFLLDNNKARIDILIRYDLNDLFKNKPPELIEIKKKNIFVKLIYHEVFIFYEYLYLYISKPDVFKNRFELIITNIKKLINRKTYNFPLLLLMIYTDIINYNTFGFNIYTLANHNNIIKKSLDAALKYNSIIAYKYLYLSTMYSNVNKNMKAATYLLQNNELDFIISNKFILLDHTMTFICDNFKLFNKFNTDNLLFIEYLYYSSIETNTIDGLLTIFYNSTISLINENIKCKEIINNALALYFIMYKSSNDKKLRNIRNYDLFNTDEVILSANKIINERIFTLSICMTKCNKRNLPEELYKYISLEFIEDNIKYDISKIENSYEYD